MKHRLVNVLLALTVCESFACAADGQVLPHRQDQPPNEPYSPLEALSKMTVPDGFRVELVASEPDIVNPVAMTFDDRGRIWITESIEYPRKPAGPGRDRVKILEDRDGDGRAETVTVFAEGLNIPTGVAVGYGGAWVLNAPDLLFLREQNGKESSREVVLTGFGRTDTHELPNSLTWGPDGWLYGLNGVFNQCHVVSKDGRKYDFTCAMWRIHPRTREFQIFAEGTSNPYGIAWNAEGSAIIEACHWANDHLFHFVETGCYQRQAGAYPPFAMKLGSITDHSHQKTAYCGIAFLDADAFPDRYRGRIGVGNIHGGCINLDRLHRDGATYLAKAEPDLLNANDAWFMPVSLKVGPDGGLYILDWYDRYHCSQDAARDPDGVDRLKGRLYRLRYGDRPNAVNFVLTTESDDQLIARLASENIFFRESAQRILTERLSAPQAHDTGGLAPRTASLQLKLESLVFDPGSSRKARLHALWSLIGGASLEASFHLRLLADDDATVRAWAVRAAGNFGKVTARIRERVTALGRDSSPDVQLQVAIASRKIAGCDALPVLVEVLTHCGQDKLIPAIVWSNLHPLLETESARFVSLLGAAGEAAGPAGSIAPAEKPKAQATRAVGSFAPAVDRILPLVIDRMLSARRPDTAAVAALLEHAVRVAAGRAPECIGAVSARIAGLDGTTLASLRERLGPLVAKMLGDDRSASLRTSAQLLAARLNIASIDAAEVRRKFVSSVEPDATRLQVLEALIAFRDRSFLDELPAVLSSAPPPFAAKMFTTLGRCDDPKLADVILAQYPSLAPEIQSLAIELILQREPWTRKLLDAVLANALPRSALNPNHLRKILESDDREAIWAVERAFGKIREERNPDREKVVTEMGGFLRQNLGDPAAGQVVFKNLCAQCHTIYGDGGRVGPDLTSNGRGSFDQVLASVFDPSLVIGPGYQTVTVVTKDGRNLTGLAIEDNDQRVVIKMPGEGEEVVPRNNVKYTRVSKLSMMPEGIETILARKDLADLFAFLSLDGPPNDPKSRPIPGAPAVSVSPPVHSEARIKAERTNDFLNVRAAVPGSGRWVDLATFFMDPKSRPYLHPVHDATGRFLLTEDRPADHPWQHGIFTGFHRVNGYNYWKEDEGRQRFVRLLDLKETADRVSWRALVEFVAPDGSIVLEEEDTITIHAPASADAYLIDFDLLLRAKGERVDFGKYFVGGLSVRMPWDKADPRQTHLNSNGLSGRACEQQRAAWCNVERLFGDDLLGIAVFDHPANANHPPGWRADEQGLINPNVSALADWSIPARQERVFRYRLLVYRGAVTREQLEARFETFAGK